VNIFLYELKANFKSFLIWLAIMALLVFVGVAKYSAYASDPALLKVIDTLPAQLIEGMSLNAFNLTTLKGFFGVMFLYFALMGALAAALWGSNIITKEECDKTVEFSLVLPVSRNQVVTAKALAALFYCIAFMLASWGFSWIAAQPYNPDADFYRFLQLEMLAMLMIELIFLALGLLLGCAIKQHHVSAPAAVSLILITYFMAIIVNMSDRFAFLKYLTPFYYYDAGQIYRSGAINQTYILISVAIILIFVVAAYWSYNKRDLYI
jgi:ABC-2 type transport system permease protein